MNNKTKQRFLMVVLAGVLALPAAAAAEEVYLIRGFMNVWSAGMDQIQKRMQEQGINASVHSNGQWRQLANDIVARSRRGRVSYPIVIMGHSLGGVEAPEFANFLVANGVPVELVVGLDPGFPKPDTFGPGIRTVINYKLPAGRAYEAGKGFTGKLRQVDVSGYGVTHTSIEKNREIQDLVIRNTRQVIRR